MTHNFYIQRKLLTGHIKYWSGKKWDRDEAKGYSTYARAFNAVTKIVKKGVISANELVIKNK